MTPSSQAADDRDPAGILFYGDPHGEWRPLVSAVLEHRPAAVVILGDCGLARPLREQLSAVWDVVPGWAWIIGNHDVDSLAEYQFLVDSFPEGDLGGRCEQLAGWIVAGLGGIYRSQVWYPKFGHGHDDPPAFRTRQEMIKRIARADRFRGGLPRSSRATIFPEDHTALSRFHADVLVAHEAPSSYRNGFVAIDELAGDMHAKLIVHGHHHCGYEGVTSDGIPVRGLAIAEPFIWHGA